MYIADLHIHSKYSRATSKSCVPEELSVWAQRKGIGLIGTGDFTHPAWRQELHDKLESCGNGFYKLKQECTRREDSALSEQKVQFVISGEISSIYKKDGKVRKVHNVILLPGLDEAEALSQRLEAIGNIHSDGRPILGLDSRDLLEITLQVCAEAIFIPAHIWTPHFSLFGAFSGFDSLEACFADMSPYIHALETGLSSDPPMNWQLSALDGYTLVSNSDAHSPAKLGREANLIDSEMSYDGLKRALEKGKEGGFAGTIEFFPEEGKYHFDGHRNCHLCLSPAEAEALGDKCPVCGKRITIGVAHRVHQLADRPDGFVPENATHFESLVPLPEVIASSIGVSEASKKVEAKYLDMLKRLGPEFYILRDAPLTDIKREAGLYIAEGIRRLRSGEVTRVPGYDGEYGKITVLDDAKIRALGGQISLFSPEELEQSEARARPETGILSNAFSDEKSADTEKMVQKAEVLEALNEQQLAAVSAPDPDIAVIAGPGTGKTKTLVSRIAYLVSRMGIKPSEITAVTFTNRAAKQMHDRLIDELGDARAVRAMQIGTFHAICLQFLNAVCGPVTVIDEMEAKALAASVIKKCGLKLSAITFLREISRCKQAAARKSDTISSDAYDQYEQQLAAAGVLDLDDLLLQTLDRFNNGEVKALQRRAFTYLLVDEFQDINEMQFQLIRAWNEKGKGLFVIGDPDQAIYGFRGSDEKCFDKLRSLKPELREIRLVHNYRSTPQILACALPVISGDGTYERKLQPHAEAGEKVKLLTAASELSEAIYVAKEIGRLVGGIDMLEAHGLAAEKPGAACDFSDIAVLYRTHRQAEVLERCLRQEGIPYVVMGKDDYLNDQNVRMTICFFAYLINMDTAFYLRTYLTLRYGMDEWEQSGLAQAIEHIESSALNLDNLRQIIGELPQRPSLNKLKENLDTFGKRIKKEKPSAIIEDWISKNELTDVEPLQRLYYMSVFYKDMRAFLENLILGQDSDVLRSSSGKAYLSGAVTLMTLHASKGLEYAAVFLCGVNEGTIPFASSGVLPNVAEERRLLYVGMTRARQRLYLITSAQPSRFLADIARKDLLCCAASADSGSRGKQLSLFDLG